MAKTSFLQRALRWGIKRRAAYDYVRALHSRTDGFKIEISDRITQAIKNDEPIVALESTIITHGMPYPANLETALQVERTVKAKVRNIHH